MPSSAGDFVSTGVYLLPLRHSGPVAKQVATLDHLSEGRFIWVGIGGEFPKEYEVAGVPISERGARLSESIEVVRELWKGKPASYDGKFSILRCLMTPPQGRMEAHLFGVESKGSRLQKNGSACRWYVSYVVSPEMYSEDSQKLLMRPTL